MINFNWSSENSSLLNFPIALHVYFEMVCKMIQRKIFIHFARSLELVNVRHGNQIQIKNLSYVHVVCSLKHPSRPLLLNINIGNAKLLTSIYLISSLSTVNYVYYFTLLFLILCSVERDICSIVKISIISFMYIEMWNKIDLFNTFCSILWLMLYAILKHTLITIM